jgi:hypothetical protein
MINTLKVCIVGVYGGRQQHASQCGGGESFAGMYGMPTTTIALVVRSIYVRWMICESAGTGQILPGVVTACAQPLCNCQQLAAAHHGAYHCAMLYSTIGCHTRILTDKQAILATRPASDAVVGSRARQRSCLLNK